MEKKRDPEPDLNNTPPLVSICCLAYNHAPFIRQCLDGFLAQKISFPIEILIHDDASTDGTEQIIRQYEKQYPEIVFPIYETTNKYSQGYSSVMDIEFNYSRAKGKYIAYCEGDDYWTDPYKLQKQVDFMEAHPEYSVCFHRCQHLNSETGEMSNDYCGRYFRNNETGVDLSFDMFFARWVTQPLTMLFRVSAFSPEWQKQYRYYRDMHEIYHLLNAGKGYLFSFVGGVYRYHKGGIHSMISQAQFCQTSLPIDEEFYRVNRNPYAKKNYLNTLSDCITYSAGHNKKQAFKYLLTHFSLSHDVHAFIKFILYIIKQK